MVFYQCENIKKSFGDNEVLKGISFTLNKGEVLSIIGSSGSGKTTLLRCINFLETPTEGIMRQEGEVLFDSSSTEKLSDSEIRKRRLNLGLVFQSFNLFPQYTVLRNVTLAPSLLIEEEVKAYKKQLKAQKKQTGEKIAIKKLVKEFEKEKLAKIEQDAHDLIARVGLTDKENSYPHELSGGQCQRAAIARALALKPDVLCFDEPTSALDPELTGEVLRVIRSLKGQDCTMIIVTHEMDFARSVSDKIIFMADGVVEEEGTPDQVFSAPKSEKLKHFLAGKDNANEQ